MNLSFPSMMIKMAFLIYFKDLKVFKALEGQEVNVDYKGFKEFKVLREFKVLKVLKESEDPKVLKVHKAFKVLLG